MAVAWNADFDISPKGSDLVGQMDDKIRESRQAIRERIAQEHLFDLDASTQQGLHKMGSGRVWLSDTEPASPIPTAILTETGGDESKGRLWIVTAAGVPTGEVKVFDGADWVSMPGSTAASILTLLKTVDGTGSGLDADLWDGKQLADLALSDVDDDATYAKTDVAGAGAANDIGDASGASTAAKLLTLVKTVDGSGSGLDADLLDGQSSAYYLPAGDYTAADVVSKISGGDLAPGSVTSSARSLSSYIARKQRTTPGNTDFQVYKPITVKLSSGAIDFYAQLGILVGTTVILTLISVGAGETSGAILNPGYYRFWTVDGSSPNNRLATLDVIGVYGATSDVSIWS